MKKFCILIALMLALPALMLTAEELAVGPQDLIIEQSLEGGYNLWVKAKPGISSVLLTESTEDPNRRAATYALRAPEYNRL